MKSLFIAGNWKSNKTLSESEDWIQKFNAQCQTLNAKWENLTIVVCAPFTAVHVLKEGVKNHQLPFSVGAQNVSMYDEGAYTGEVSARMIRELADWVIVGHSERRKYFNETDEVLAVKVEKAHTAGLKVIYCVPDDVTAVPSGVAVVAYEPIWAIGTGKTDTPENADSVCTRIKQKSSMSVVIYGGSVTAENVASFCAMSHIEGVLPGGASLDPVKFSQLIGAAQNAVL